MKRILSVLIVFGMMLSLAACSGGLPAPADPTDAPATEAPETTPEPTEAPAETEAPDPEVFVPEGYDANDYLALAEFFSTPVEEFGTTIGAMCYDDYANGEFDVKDPSTWKTEYHGVKWDEEGRVTEITFYPAFPELPAALDLSGFDHLKKVWTINTTVASSNIYDCAGLDGDSMVYVYATGDVSLEAGCVETLWLQSRSNVYCSLMGDKDPFVMDLTANGPGAVVASSALVDGVYEVRAYAMPDEYAEFVGWYDEDGGLVSDVEALSLGGDGQGSVSGVHSYLAVFANPAAPTPLPEGDYFCEIKPDVPAEVDIDGDGEADTVLVRVGKEAPDGNHLSVSITLAADPGSPYEFDAGVGHSLFAAAVDTDVSDSHIEVLLCYDMCDGDPITYVFRMKDDGSGFDVFTKDIDLGSGMWWYNGPEDYVFKAEEGLPFSIRTEILGTHFVFSHFTVTADGIVFTDEEFAYNFVYELTLVKDLTVTLENGKEYTVRTGEKVSAYSTDRATYVRIRLSDGRIGTVEVTFGNTEYCFPVFLNGVQQDEYFDQLPYAD